MQCQVTWPWSLRVRYCCDSYWCDCEEVLNGWQNSVSCQCASSVLYKCGCSLVLSWLPRRRQSGRLLSQSFSHENLTLEENSCRMISMPGHDRRRALKGTDDLASFPSCLPKLLKPRQWGIWCRRIPRMLEATELPLSVWTRATSCQVRNEYGKHLDSKARG